MQVYNIVCNSFVDSTKESRTVNFANQASEFWHMAKEKKLTAKQRVEITEHKRQLVERKQVLRKEIMFAV